MVKKAHTLELKEKISELEEKYHRALADYQNLERRQKETQSQMVKMANASLIEKLLINIDSLELAQKHLDDKGLQMVINHFHQTLSQEGLTSIKSDGHVFDPISMDCTEVIPGKKNYVIETVATGYLLFDKVLRPAKVKVGSGIVTKN